MRHSGNSIILAQMQYRLAINAQISTIETRTNKDYKPKYIEKLTVCKIGTIISIATWINEPKSYLGIKLVDILDYYN